MPKKGRIVDIGLERRAACTPEIVMEKVLDPHTWSSWQPEIDSASGPTPLRTGDVVRGRAHLLGFHVEGLSTAMAAEERSFEEDVIVGVRMKVRYEVRPDEERSIVVRRLWAELPGGVSGRLLSVFLAWRLRRMQRNVVEGLVAEAERG